MLFVVHMDKVLLSDMFAKFIFYSMHHGIDNILKLRWESFMSRASLVQQDGANFRQSFNWTWFAPRGRCIVHGVAT